MAGFTTTADYRLVESSPRPLMRIRGRLAGTLDTPAWVIGRALHTAMQKTIAEPGSGDWILERGRIRLTGARALRTAHLPNTKAVLIAVWRESLRRREGSIE